MLGLKLIHVSKRGHRYKSRTASHQCSTSSGCRSLAPIPTTSWLDLWTWDCNSCHGQELHPCPNWGSGWSSPLILLGSHHCWKQTPPVVLLAQLLPHQQLPASRLWCQMGQRPCCISPCLVLLDQSCRHTRRGGGGVGRWGIGETREVQNLAT